MVSLFYTHAEFFLILIGRGFFSNFKSLLNIGVFKGLYRAFPTAMVGAAPKVTTRVVVSGRKLSFAEAFLQHAPLCRRWCTTAS